MIASKLVFDCFPINSTKLNIPTPTKASPPSVQPLPMYQLPPPSPYKWTAPGFIAATSFSYPNLLELKEHKHQPNKPIKFLFIFQISLISYHSLSMKFCKGKHWH
jgi:hypothetical protein